MKKTIVIADDFYEDPKGVEAYAKSLPFIYPYNKTKSRCPATEVAWRASRWKRPRECPFKSSELLISKLEFLTGERIDRDNWDLDFPLDADGYPVPHYDQIPRSPWWNCTFHLKHHFQDEGQGVHSHTDRDSWNAVGENGWAGLVYLNKHAPPQAGLRTWTNVDVSHQFDWMTPKEDWILCDTLANLYNRIILHRGGIPHSGAAGWGTSLDDGRLFQTIFFRTLSQHQSKSVWIKTR